MAKIKIISRIAVLVSLITCIRMTVVQAGDITVKIELFPEIKNARMLFLQDFDLMQLGYGPLLFRVSMMNHRQKTMQVIGKFSVISEKLGGVLYGTTRPFELGPGMASITNHELFSRQSVYGLADYELEAASEALRNSLMQTGKLPTDRYIFRWQVIDTHNSGNDDQSEDIIYVDNPTVIDLIAPGAFVSGGTLPIIYTTLPYLQWDSPASQFRLMVCEAIGSSPEESMEYDPHLNVIVKNANYYQYTAAGASVFEIIRPLEEGKTYYWQVRALVETSGEPIELPSEIWGFTIGNIDAEFVNSQKKKVLAHLQSVIGTEMFNLLFGTDGQLKDFDITGNFILNGKPIQMEILLKLIEDIIAGKMEVKELHIEDL